MSDLTDRERDGLRAWIREEEVKLVAAQHACAIGWAIIVEDKETGTRHVYGTVEDAAEALVRSARIADELNETAAAEDAPYVVTAMPLLPLEDWGT